MYTNPCPLSCYPGCFMYFSAPTRLIQGLNLQNLQKPVNQLLSQIRCVGAETPLKHAGLWNWTGHPG